jgi:uncharacterized phage-associated protein
LTNENKTYVFDDVRVLAKLVRKISSREMTPLRLQKTLYFVFAFYGATLGKLSPENQEENKFEGSANYPKYLFEEQFEAWQYGPVLRSMYTINKHRKYEILEAEEWEIKDEKDQAIYDLIEQVVKQTDEMGDFTLVERTHEDQAWKDAFESENNLMSRDAIVEEYKLELI